PLLLSRLPDPRRDGDRPPGRCLRRRDAARVTHVVGVDIGGTFTDCIVVDHAGTVTIGKAPSTPPDFQTGFVDAMASAARRMGIPLGRLVAEAAGIYHGCTVG